MLASCNATIDLLGLLDREPIGDPEKGTDRLTVPFEPVERFAADIGGGTPSRGDLRRDSDDGIRKRAGAQDSVLRRNFSPRVGVSSRHSRTRGDVEPCGSRTPPAEPVPTIRGTAPCS